MNEVVFKKTFFLFVLINTSIMLANVSENLVSGQSGEGKINSAVKLKREQKKRKKKGSNNNRMSCSLS